MVGTTKKSMETKSLAWFLRKVRHDWEGGFRCRTMYLATVACDTGIPSFRSSPWIRGAPNRGLARVIFRMRFRTSGDTDGRPLQHRLFHVQ